MSDHHHILYRCPNCQTVVQTCRCIGEKLEKPKLCDRCSRVTYTERSARVTVAAERIAGYASSTCEFPMIIIVCDSFATQGRKEGTFDYATAVKMVEMPVDEAEKRLKRTALALRNVMERTGYEAIRFLGLEPGDNYGTDDVANSDD